LRPYLEKKLSQKRAGGLAQGIGPELKPQYHKTNKQKNSAIVWIGDPKAHVVKIWMPARSAIRGVETFGGGA
jgi:hypothetical protein